MNFQVRTRYSTLIKANIKSMFKIWLLKAPEIRNSIIPNDRQTFILLTLKGY